MTSLSKIGEDLAAAEVARADMTQAHKEFLSASQSGDWERAERARQAATAHFEAHLDAFTRAWKRTNGAG